MKLPVDYRTLDWRKGEVRRVREQYIKEQDGVCMYCKALLKYDPPDHIFEAEINWGLFPPNFQKHPVHLQHSHDTHMTEGAVHMRCNAYMWQYEGR